jgi:L-asparaginase II
VVRVLRGGLLESIHRVHCAVVALDGKLLAHSGDPEYPSFLRSSAKAMQALPFVVVADALGLGARHLAVAVASHAGSDQHVAVVRELLAAAGLGPELLVCGQHPPFDPTTRRELAKRGEAAGVHSAMLAVAQARGWPTAGYTQPNHPLQREILGLVVALTGASELAVAIDGCSAPTFRLGLRHAARGFARLADPEHPGFARIFAAKHQHPELVAGVGRLDTQLMQALPQVASKIGAEGYHALAIRHPQHGPIGVALKLEDGQERARNAAVLRVLHDLAILNEAEYPHWSQEILYNNAGLVVGQVEAGFRLQFT